MKKFITYIIFTCAIALCSFQGYAQGRTPVNEVMNAIRSNRIEEVSRFFDAFVPVTINNNQGNYSHNQAEFVLRDFFDKNPPKDFKIMDIGSMGQNSQYGIAKFTAPSGRYGIYIALKQSGSNYLIRDIKINRE